MIRSLLAAVLTTALPTMVGARWFRGPAAARYGLGSLVGVGALGAGAVLGAMAGLLLPGAAAGVVIAWVLGPRLALNLGAPAGEAGDRLLRVLLGVVGVVGLALLAMSLFRPVAWWDGWMTWSLKAKSLALTGDYSGAVFAEPIYAQSHPDYPPLLSAWQAVAYVLQGTSEVSWPTQLQLAWLWTAGAAGLVTLAARWGRGAALVALAWAAAPHLVRQQMSGYADVPMALFLVAGAALLVRRGHPRQAWLAGGLLAVGALIKLEGLPLALLVAAPMLLLPDRRADALRAGAVVVGAFLPWAAFVRLQGFTNDLAAGLGETAPGLATMAGRVPVVAFWVARELLWPLRWSLLTLSCVAVLVLVRRAPWAMVASAALSLGAFALVYVTSPLDFDFHIRFSMDRVVTAPLGFLAVATASAVGAWSSRAPSRTGGSSRPEPAPGSANRRWWSARPRRRHIRATRHEVAATHRRDPRDRELATCAKSLAFSVTITRSSAVAICTSTSSGRLCAPSRDGVTACTRTVRGLLSELPLGPADGLPEACGASFDNLHTVRRQAFRERIVVLSPARQRQMCEVLGAALGCPSR